MSPRAATLMGLALGALCACAASGPRAPADPARVRAFAALPDWTGLWETEAAHSLIETGRMMRPALWGKPPYNAEWTQRQADTGAGGTRPGPIDLPADAKICAPGGFPTAMDVPVADYQLNYLLTPEQVVIVTNDGTVRHIHTDGRGHPSDVWPTADGHSIGRWEGDTLVVETIARKAGPVGPVPEAAVLGENARFTERIRRLDDERMQIELTIEDPERLAQPWNLLLRYRRVHDLDRIIYLDCRENDRNPFVDGQFIIAPPR